MKKFRAYKKNLWVVQSFSPRGKNVLKLEKNFGVKKSEVGKKQRYFNNFRMGEKSFFGVDKNFNSKFNLFRRGVEKFSGAVFFFSSEDNQN